MGNQNLFICKSTFCLYSKTHAKTKKASVKNVMCLCAERTFLKGNIFKIQNMFMK